MLLRSFGPGRAPPSPNMFCRRAGWGVGVGGGVGRVFNVSGISVNVFLKVFKVLMPLEHDPGWVGCRGKCFLGEKNPAGQPRQHTKSFEKFLDDSSYVCFVFFHVC